MNQRACPVSAGVKNDGMDSHQPGGALRGFKEGTWRIVNGLPFQSSKRQECIVGQIYNLWNEASPAKS